MKLKASEIFTVIKKCILAALAGFILNACGNQTSRNNYKDYSWKEGIESGMWWPDDQLLPIFARPDKLDAVFEMNFHANSVGEEEAKYALLFASLQGIVNSEKPRILVLRYNHWIPHMGFSLNLYMFEERFELIKKYQSYIKGIVLYDTSISPQYVNLASTIANINKGYVPVTRYIKDQLEENGIFFENKNIIDITGLDMKTDYRIYRYLYDTYWKKCSKRLLINLPAHHFFPVRDIAAATGAAVIYPDVQTPEGKMILELFLKDMADSKSSSVIMGWYTNERQGIVTATNYGIPTLPADFYRSGTVYGGVSHLIKPPRVPKRGELENKAYIALYMSDGDNIQYVQNAMTGIWNRSRNYRGKTAINWTIAPSLSDIGPGILNYFYGSATDKEYFVTGPSGLGYIMPFNSALGAKDHLDSPKYAADFARMNEIYLQKSGLRVITVWDGANDMVRNAYEQYGRNLYGLTIQDWRREKYPEVMPSTVNNRLRFDQLNHPYQSNYDILYNGTTDDLGYVPGIADELKNWDEKSPLFLSYQLQAWSGEVNTQQMVRLEAELREEFPDKNFEFVRADHYFSYYNELNGLPFNLCMLDAVSVSTSGNNQNIEYLTDGTSATLWETGNNDREIFIQFDFGKEYSINRYVLRHAESNGMDKKFNTKSWKVDVSSDNKNWTAADRYTKNTSPVTDIDINPVNARYVKIVITNSGDRDTVRIADVEIYGSRLAVNISDNDFENITNKPVKTDFIEEEIADRIKKLSFKNKYVIPLDTMVPGNVTTMGAFGTRDMQDVKLENGELVISSYGGVDCMQTADEYSLPLRIDLTVKTNCDNIRLYYKMGEVIFNWEVNMFELRIHDLLTGSNSGYYGIGHVPINEFADISWILHEEFLAVTVNGELRLAGDGFPYIEMLKNSPQVISSRFGIGSAFGSTISIRSLKILN